MLSIAGTINWARYIRTGTGREADKMIIRENDDGYITTYKYYWFCGSDTAFPFIPSADASLTIAIHVLYIMLREWQTYKRVIIFLYYFLPILARSFTFFLRYFNEILFLFNES